MERRTDTPLVLLFFFGAAFICNLKLSAQASYENLNVKTPKHYFNTIIVLDGYGKSSVNLDTTTAIDRRLKKYGIRQSNLSFCIPLVTHDFKGRGIDSNVIENTHLLLTGNFFSLQPVFNGIPQHTLTKRGIGLRYIYNTGKKGVWFFDMAPFVTRDISYTSRPYLRLASTFVYSHNISDKLNLRIGATKSFMFGNRLYLPFIGFRFGRLDRINLSLQFPRSATLSIPFNYNFAVSLFVRPQGGMFNFSNHDTLYYKPNVATFHFTYYEMNSGLRFDARIGSHFSFFGCGGFSTGNSIVFYSDNANKIKAPQSYFKYFYRASPANALFAQFGLVLKLGKTRSINNNRNLYDAIDLNSKIDINDGNSQIPVTPKKAKKDPNLESIQDLIDYNDF